MKNDKILWRTAIPTDIADIVELAQKQFQQEILGLLRPDPYLYEYNLQRAIMNQAYFPTTEQVIVAYQDTELCAYAWIARGIKLDYSHDEIAEGKFIHLDLTLSPRQRIALCQQALENWLRWSEICGVDLLISSSVRAEQKTFMRLHERLGFSVRGSIAYKRIK